MKRRCVVASRCGGAAALIAVAAAHQIYLLRWVRLLFAREFHIEDVMRLWDAIFALADGRRDIDKPAVASVSSNSRVRRRRVADLRTGQ